MQLRCFGGAGIRYFHHKNARRRSCRHGELDFPGLLNVPDGGETVLPSSAFGADSCGAAQPGSLAADPQWQGITRAILRDVARLPAAG